MAILVLLAAVNGCSHTAAEMRLYCLRVAHKTVKVPEYKSSEREPMVDDLYQRCLQAYDVPDAPLPGR